MAIIFIFFMVSCSKYKISYYIQDTTIPVPIKIDNSLYMQPNPFEIKFENLSIVFFCDYDIN